MTDNLFIFLRSCLLLTRIACTLILIALIPLSPSEDISEDPEDAFIDSINFERDSWRVSKTLCLINYNIYFLTKTEVNNFCSSVTNLFLFLFIYSVIYCSIA